MSTHTFTFDSDYFDHDGYCSAMNVEINIFMNRNEDVEYEIENIYDTTTNSYKELSDFPEYEQDKINARAQAIADRNQDEAYQEYLEYQGDLAYDRMKDEE